MKYMNFPPRRVIALLTVIFTATGIMLAAPRSVEQARKAAAVQMKKHSAKKSPAHGGTVTAVSPQLVLAKEKKNKDEAYYYVFSAGRDLGYTIVSGDDRLPEIVGYTESGNYDADRLPDNLASFMQAYQDFADNATDEQIEEIRQWKAQAKHAAVAPLMAEKWNQTAPYNNMCPEFKYNGSSGVESDRAVTGCVATAIAQILHYHHCPDVLKENISGYTTKMTVNGYENTITMPEISTADGVYDWQNMLNVYGGNETQAQNDAVAKLMLHVGCAVKMNYGPSSGASASAETFTKYFGMDQELVQQVQRSSYNISQWDKMLYDEIAAQRPVYYDGQSTGGGHAFVIHGYDDGLYFVNWGWGGYCDGYFDITILNPNSTSGAGASSSDDGYSMDNSMIIGITPDNGMVDEVSTSKITSYKKLQVNGVNISGTQITANVEIFPLNSNLDGKINVSVGYADNNGKYVNIGTSIEIDSQNLQHNYYFQTSTQISFQYEEGKTYKLCLIESADSQSWTVCAGDEVTSTTIKIENNTFTEVSQNYTLTATAALDTENSGGYAGMSNTINITVSNSGDKEYYDKVYVRVGTGDTMPADDAYTTGITAPVSGSTTFNFAYTPQTAGTYNFWILDADKQQIGKSIITFQTATAPALSFVSIKCNNASDEKVYADFLNEKVEMNKVNDTKTEFTFEIKNDGGYYEGPFYLLKYNAQEGNWSNYPETLKIPANATTTFTFTVEGNAGSAVGLSLASASQTATITGLTTTNNHTIQSGGSFSFGDSEICYLAGIPENAEAMAITYSVTDDDVDRLNNMLAENNSITSIDLSKASSVKTTKEITTGNPNTLLYVKAGARIGNTKNVIVENENGSYTCENLQLSDAKPFEAQHEFAATNATYERTTANGWCSIYLPFAVSSIPNGITVEKFVSVDTENKTVTFEKVTSMDAYTPYIYNRNGNATFSNSNVKIRKTEGQTGNAEFVGTLTGIAAPNLDGYYILKSDGSGFGIATNTATASPFRAVIKVDAAQGAPILKTIHNGDDGTTGISELDADAENGDSYYNLRGEKVNTPTKGIYIKNGKKYIFK